MTEFAHKVLNLIFQMCFQMTFNLKNICLFFVYRYPDVFIEERKKKIYSEKNAALRRVYNRLVLSKIKNLYYIPGNNLIGNDSEATVDGVHPTDLGFIRMAGIFEPVLKKALR